MQQQSFPLCHISIQSTGVAVANKGSNTVDTSDVQDSVVLTHIGS